MLTPRDRRELIDDADDSEHESAKIAQRIRRDMAADAAEGRPHGVCPAGLRPVYDEPTGKLIVELFTLLRGGRSFRGLAKDFEAKGYVQRTGVGGAGCGEKSGGCAGCG
ncbi:hypothetical protein [Herbidospora solisilvae]|uniref:hypothetical protein n=1 Tax=Herbidospora solisilvae TaxID=2696284 RepID=UPI001929DEEF|nr:hypothetical protein [Herbidospora solisilvae]